MDWAALQGGTFRMWGLPGGAKAQLRPTDSASGGAVTRQSHTAACVCNAAA